jgi:hypothetical protein
MKTETRSLFGPMAALVFFFGVFGLSLLLPDYSQVHQDISTIGKMGSPLRVPFSVVFVFYASSLLIFASGIFNAASFRALARRCWHMFATCAASSSALCGPAA